MKKEIEFKADLPKPPDGYGEVYFGAVNDGDMAWSGTDWRICKHATAFLFTFVATKPKQYREPVLPADAGEPCNFSDDRINWCGGILKGYMQQDGWFDEEGTHWHYCRIEADE
jgi:hypothetical protein